jgi:hypothetical protein
MLYPITNIAQPKAVVESKIPVGTRTQEGSRWLVHCVKCGFRGKVSDALPAAPDAKPRWHRFVTLVTCPNCGDDKGHCGVLGDADFAPSDFPVPQAEVRPLPPIAWRTADALVGEILNALSPNAAVEALRTVRGYDPQLAHWLADRGVRFGRVADLRFKVSPTTLAALPQPRSLSPTSPAFGCLSPPIPTVTDPPSSPCKCAAFRASPNT